MPLLMHTLHNHERTVFQVSTFKVCRIRLCGVEGGHCPGNVYSQWVAGKLCQSAQKGHGFYDDGGIGIFFRGALLQEWEAEWEVGRRGRKGKGGKGEREGRTREGETTFYYLDTCITWTSVRSPAPLHLPYLQSPTILHSGSSYSGKLCSLPTQAPSSSHRSPKSLSSCATGTRSRSQHTPTHSTDTVQRLDSTFNKTCNVVVQSEKRCKSCKLQSTLLDLCASSVHSNQALCKQL